MKRFLSHLAVIAVVLALPGLALAQRGGGGGRGGPGFGGGGRGGYGGGFDHGYYGHGYYGHGFYGRGFYGGFFGFDLYGYGYGYGSCYPYGYYGYYGVNGDPLLSPITFPRVVYPAYATPEYAAQAPPVGPDYGPLPPPKVALPNNRAQVQVIVPDASATVWFDNNKTALQGKVRLFDPPELQPGAYYVYKITVSWVQGGQTVTDVRSATVTGGQVTVVDFTRPASPEPLGPPLPSKKSD
jgi:uncharacterized protein (TIGR03000 family)